MKEALLAHFSDIPMKERYVPSRVGPPILRSSFSEARFRHNFRVLVPGAGLGRLAYEVAKLGERISLSFDSATEPTASLRIFLPRQRVFALHAADLVFHSQSVCRSFLIRVFVSTILNLCPAQRTQQVNQHTIYPYVHTLSNVPDRAAVLKRVQIPDVLPRDLPPGSNFSLVAGDFEEVYGQQDGDADPDEPSAGLWDAVLTCFFIDTVSTLSLVIDRAQLTLGLCRRKIS
jgi:carnosine N-methyltransferase